MRSGLRTESERQRRLFQKERRGSGDGREYVPARAPREMAGGGRLHRFACTRCGRRQIVLPSDGILAVFLDEEWDSETCELKEYFPHLEVEKTLQIAKSLGVKHPALRDGSPALLVTTLLVYKQANNQFRRTAIDISSSRSKQCDFPSASRQIKAEFWRQAGVSYRIVYSDGLNSHRAKHLWDLFNVRERVLVRGLTDDERDAQDAVLRRFRARKDATLLDVCREAAYARGIPRADCVAAMRRLIALRLIECSLDVPVLLAQPRSGARICIENSTSDNGIPSNLGRESRKIA